MREEESREARKEWHEPLHYELITQSAFPDSLPHSLPPPQRLLFRLRAQESAGPSHFHHGKINDIPRRFAFFERDISCSGASAAPGGALGFPR